ncbi:LysR substrate-binding domain-containing protein [Kaistia nematophila]|uniref:LysR substrate-binding domain-containing protein n=1 Tax=Kaistia nematophila TaxID=2994654 RepID=A0A9X3E6K0_9HYPH|nr:LysR substrate-binding domain-containing protein [Kaistia nematophila]MCX5572116.1 LysR substrate-binding domain-containing protein [Kaistia nematophila]
MRLPPNLDMDVLRSFVLGIQLNSFAQAAQRIGRSQSAVSLQMRKLEQQANCEVFRKNGRGLQLTEVGETLFRYAQRILELNDEAISAVDRSDMSGRISIGMPPDFAETWLPGVLGRFARVHPNVLVEARVDRGATLLEDLGAGQIDLVLLWGDTQAEPNRPGRSLAEFPIVWVGPEGFDPDAADPLPLVMMGAPCMFRSAGMSALDAAGRPWRLAFTSTSLSGLWGAVTAGLGVTIRTPEGIPPHLKILRHPSLPDLGRTRLRIHTTASPSPPVKRFTSILEEYMSIHFAKTNLLPRLAAVG